MKPSDFKLRPEIAIPNMDLDDLLAYPELHKRVNNRQFEISGIHNLISEMKKQTIDNLKQQFIANNNEVNLPKFMWLMSKCLSMSNLLNQPEIVRVFYHYSLAYQLVKVFEEIDIDNSKSISWEELIEYMTCSSLTNIQIQNKEDEVVSKKYNQVQFGHKEKAIFRKNSIRHLLQLQKHGLLGILEKKSDNLTFIDILGGSPNKDFQLINVDYNKILSIDYSEEDRMFGILLNTHVIMFIQDGEMQKNHGQMKFSGNQIQIKYLKHHQSWILISMDQTLQIFKPPKGRIQNMEEKQKMRIFKAHETTIISIKELTNPLSLCTASFGGEIKLWSLTTNRLLINLKPNKEEDFLKCKSIKGVQVYNKSLVTYIICWMFSNDISVWLPSSSISKPYIGALRGHAGIVEEAKFLINFPIVISIDNKNSVRVSNIEKMQCLQIWRVEENFSPKIFVLKSAPYLIFYDKLLFYYKIQRQEDFIMLNSRKNHEQVKKSELTNQVVLGVKYCNYYDCLLILLQDQLKVLAINSGKIFTQIHAPKGTNFLAMCLKEHRRVFIQSNKNEIFFYRLDDGSLVLKFEPFLTNPQNLLKGKKGEQAQPEVLVEIFTIEYNAYNQSLMIIAESDKFSKISVYDYSEGYEPFKIKEVIFNQISLTSFVSCQETNYFYISSFNPNLISIWNYETFTIIKTLIMENPILSMSTQGKEYNLLIITEMLGIRIFQLPLLELRKNYWKSEENFIKKQIYIKSNEKLSSCQIAQIKSQYKKKEKKKFKRKVTFLDETQNKINFSETNKNFRLFVLTTASLLYILNAESLLQKLTPLEKNLQSEKKDRKLTREQKKIQIQPEVFSVEISFTFNMKDIISEINSSLKSEVKIFGRIIDLFYAFTSDGLLTFFQNDALVCGRISFPSGDLIQWEICYPLIEKVLSRLEKVYKMSQDLRLNKQIIQKSEYLKKSFILNRYFTEKDLSKLKEFGEKNSPKFPPKQIVSNSHLTITEDCIYANFDQNNEKEQKVRSYSKGLGNNYFENMYHKKIDLKINSNQKKIDELSKKYFKAFSYIKEKKEQIVLKQEIKKQNESSNQVKKKSSNFKVRTSAKSITKNYLENTKQTMEKNQKIKKLEKLDKS